MKRVNFFVFSMLIFIGGTFCGCNRDDVVDNMELYPDWSGESSGNDSDGENVELTKGEVIDLGLSVKWASYNVGASAPEEYGGLYGWADPTGEKTTSDLDVYPTPIPPENICGTKYDIARAKWGDDWRLPTVDEFKELVQKCDWYWATYKGTEGTLVVGPNGNSIFLPAGGCANDRLVGGNMIAGLGHTCYYWSGTLYGTKYQEYLNRAYFLYCDKYTGDLTWSKYTQMNYRSTGHSVRPVIDN